MANNNDYLIMKKYQQKVQIALKPKLFAQKGGFARAASLVADDRKLIASNAAHARWKKWRTEHNILPN